MNRYACVALLFAAWGFTRPALADSCSLKLLTSLDMKPADDDNRIFVTGTINGTEVQFLLDTGGSLSTVTGKTVAALKLTKQAADTRILDMSGYASERFVRLDSLQLGQLKAKNMNLMILPGDDGRFDGLIGGDILDNYDVELNFATHKVNLFSQNHCEGKVVYWPASAGTAVPFSTKNPMRNTLYAEIGHGTQIHVPVTLDGKQFQAIIDTGATGTVMSAGVAEAAFGLTAASPGAQQGDDQEFNYTFHSLSLEGINIANPHLTIIPEQMGTKDYDNTVVTGSMITKANDGMQPEFIIGMDVLSKLHLYIAYGEKKLYITPPDQPVAAAGR